MRLYLKLTQNTKLIPFAYQELLTGVIHKWLGEENIYHGTSGVFSFSWLMNTKADGKKGINLTENSYFFVSSVDEEFIRHLLKGILDDPEMFNGISVYDVSVKKPPRFEGATRFLMGSPVLLKGKEDKRHLTFEDESFEQELTENLKTKLTKAGLDAEGVTVRLDPNSTYRKTRMIDYKGVFNRVTYAPLIIDGTEEQLQFAWLAGLGHSTGIGLGSLK